MTRTAIYSLQDNALTEQPQLSQPVLSVGGIFSPYAEIDRRRLVAYNKHIATLRTIPCHESARSLWKDGQKVEEGKDYEAKFTDPDSYVLTAFPMPVKSEQGEDELWEDICKTVIENSDAEDYDCGPAIMKLQQKYIITKR